MGTLGVMSDQASRDLFTDDHETFRSSVASFVAKEMVPHYSDWEAAGIMPREVFAAAGKYGFLGMAIPEKWGGGGTDDFRFNVVLAEELAAAGIGGAGLGLTLHNDICTPYFIEYCNDEQAKRWLPGIASGELITAVAMTEPGTGSDLAGIATTAIRDGDEYVLNGSKTFITNGINADLVIVAAKTDPTQRHSGMSLLVVERGMPGFERGRNLEKIGLHSQDTAELFFDDVRVPAANLFGEEGQGFNYLTANLAQERLSIAVTGVASAAAALGWTVEYVKRAQGLRQVDRRLPEHQVRARRGEDPGRRCPGVRRPVCRSSSTPAALDPTEAAQAKYFCTEVQQKVVDQCLQLFGGYGFMIEYPIARAYADARVTTIYGGTTEVMKTIIAKSLGL